METEDQFQPWERLVALAHAADSDGLEAYLDAIGPSEAFRALVRLEPAERELVLTTLSPGEASTPISITRP